MADQIHSTKFQDKIERNVFLMLIMLAVLVAIPGAVEIIPLFYLDDTMEHKRAANADKTIIWDRQAGQTLSSWKAGDGVRPYTPLELAGREVYIREGCYTCHSQMIRPFRDEKERYGHYSLASESMYDHPFQWGSKRTGPDLARVGGKYSDAWHVQHLKAPRSVVPESVMPNYVWLEGASVDADRVAKTMGVMRIVGVPYEDADIDAAADGVNGKSEMDALVAYLQVLGTMVKFDDTHDYRD